LVVDLGDRRTVEVNDGLNGLERTWSLFFSLELYLPDLPIERKPNSNTNNP